jgi:hypothetical protein
MLDYNKIIRNLKNKANNPNIDLKILHDFIVLLINATPLISNGKGNLSKKQLDQIEKDNQFREELKKILKIKPKVIQHTQVIIQPPIVEPILPIETEKKDIEEPKKILKKKDIVYAYKNSNKFNLIIEYDGKQYRNFGFTFSNRKGDYINPFGNKYAKIVIKSRNNRIYKKVPYSDFIIEEDEKYKYLRSMTDFVIDFHKDVFNVLCKRYPRWNKKFQRLRFNIGKLAHRKGGHYCRPTNTIQINKDLIVLTNKNENIENHKKYILREKINTIYHELIHVFFYNHKGDFHYWNNKFDREIYKDERFKDFLPKIELLVKLKKW